MKFADLHAGQVIAAGSVTVSEAEILAFARQFDPQWFHTDPQRAAAGPHGALIASGWHTGALAMRLAVAAVLGGDESYGSPGLAHVRWPHPVRAGDTLALTITVLEARRSASKPDVGVVHWRWQMHNQRGHEVLDLEATSLYRLG